jgi:import inner membrane translocase subunit TIM21
MLRSAASLGLRHGSRLASSRKTVVLRVLERNNQPGLLRPTSSMGCSPWRTFASQPKQDSPKEEKSSGDDDETKELVLTPGQKVVAASRLGLWAGVAAFALACAYYIGRELIPTKMSPNTVFNKAASLVRKHPQVLRQYGESIKVYGRDHGGHREGRRNFVENTQYDSPDGDGSKRTRVRFNLEGQFAGAFCFAEVSNQMSSGEFVYVLVQDKQSGRVITVVDNRAALTAKRLAGGNQESASAMQQLLGGGSKSN